MSELLTVEERLKTFKKWPFKSPSKCTKERMAEAGFEYKGTRKEPDAASCVFCCKELDGWEKDDDPWTEHKNHAPYCKFIKLGKDEKDITLEEMLELEGYRQENRITRLFNEKEKSFITSASKTKEKISKMV